jgi:transcriptional regulator with XRE-family HTH domain
MGNKMKQLRENAGLTQEEVAKAIGVGQSAVSMWETGESVPRSRILLKIADVYGCEIADLFSESE